jgi:hypothetical protein
VDVYSIQEKTQTYLPDVMLQNWGYSAKVDAYLIRQTVSSLQDAIEHNKLWQFNATFGVQSGGFTFSSAESTSAYLKFAFEGGHLTIRPDADLVKDGAKFTATFTPNAKKNVFDLSVSTRSTVPSKHAPVIDLWVEFDQYADS